MDKQRVMQTLRDAMERTGVRGADIARACDISPQAVSNWFKTGTVSRENLMIAAKLVGLTLDQLMHNEAPKPLPVDKGLLTEAIEEVADAIKTHGRGRDVSAETLAQLISDTYDSLVLAEQAKKAVSDKLSQLFDNPKAEK
jgi:transcriptional regulator with XRE-family HTH domain